MDNRTCIRCHIVFTPTHARQLYCTPEHRRPEHAKITVNCDCCGAPATKYKQAKRYGATYCGTLCRDFAQFGPTDCRIPRDHWARWYGRTSTWVPPTIRNTGQCQWCGASNDRDRSAAYCTPDCKQKAKRQRRRAAEHHAQGEYTWAQVMEQYRRQGYVCAYCQARVNGLPQPEHVVPLSRGGRNDMANIVAACQRCNSDKRDLLLDEWNADRLRRGLPEVRTSLKGKAFLRLVA